MILIDIFEKLINKCIILTILINIFKKLIYLKKNNVDWAGFEPAASAQPMRRSPNLSYQPILASH